ncbi:MAG TPA: hypothetical protein VIY71_01405 [Solirubrobacterales bacterium]
MGLFARTSPPFLYFQIWPDSEQLIRHSAASGHFETEQPGGDWACVALSAEDLDRLRAVPTSTAPVLALA